MEQMLLITQGQLGPRPDSDRTHKSQGIYSINKKWACHLHERNAILKINACLIIKEPITPAGQCFLAAK